MHPADDNALNTEEKIWDLTMQINVKGVWWGCKYAILAMRENKADPGKGLTQGGSVINTASFVAIMGAATPQLACTCDCFRSERRTVNRSYHMQIPPQRLVHELTNGFQIDSGVCVQGAVLSMTRELAMVHAREGIRFNSICP